MLTEFGTGEGPGFWKLQSPRLTELSGNNSVVWLFLSRFCLQDVLCLCLRFVQQGRQCFSTTGGVSSEPRVFTVKKFGRIHVPGETRGDDSD